MATNIVFNPFDTWLGSVVAFEGTTQKLFYSSDGGVTWSQALGDRSGSHKIINFEWFSVYSLVIEIVSNSDPLVCILAYFFV